MNLWCRVAQAESTVAYIAPTVGASGIQRQLPSALQVAFKLQLATQVLLGPNDVCNALCGGCVQGPGGVGQVRAGQGAEIGATGCVFHR